MIIIVVGGGELGCLSTVRGTHFLFVASGLHADAQQLFQLQKHLGIIKTGRQMTLSAQWCC